MGASNQKKMGLVVTSMVMSIIAAVMSFIQLGLTAGGIVVNAEYLSHYRYYSYNHHSEARLYYYRVS